MSCGTNDLLCYIIGLLAQHGIEITAVLRIWPWIEERVLANLQSIVGLAGFSFGLWKWWYFRERVLHKRLKEYLQHQDEKLLHARSYVLEALYRPGASRNFAVPLFAVRPLRRVLRRRGWNSILFAAKVETGADYLLNKALRQLNGRLDAAEKQISGLRQQQASAYLLKGAIASARVDGMAWGASSTQFDYRALDAFRAAIQIPGHEADVELIEFEAHQLRKLGHLGDADQRYEFLEGRAPSITEPKARDLLLARAKRWRAVVAQSEAIQRSQANQGGRGSAIADALVRQEGGSIPLRTGYAPFQEWECLEQGDLHYFSAFVCFNLGFNVQAGLQLGLAETEYRRIMHDNSEGKWRLRTSNRRLRDAAKAGLSRVQQARDFQSYDEKWLLPPLHPLERPASQISGGGGQQTVGETPKQREVEGQP